jgi:hypothetical protein
MSQPSGHSDLGPELRELAQALLDRLDPAVRAAAAMAGDALRGPSRCEQVWCPVCALAAVVNGEQHPLLTLLAEHSETLLTVVRAMAEEQASADPTASPPADPQAGPTIPGAADPPVGGESPPPSSNGRYHHIPIVVETVLQTSGEPSA